MKYLLVFIAVILWCTTIYTFAVTKRHCAYSHVYGKDLCLVAKTLAEREREDDRPIQFDPDIHVRHVHARDSTLSFDAHMNETKQDIIERIWGLPVAQQKVDTFLAGHLSYGICHYAANQWLETFLINKGTAEYHVLDRNGQSIGETTLTRLRCR
ncbi:hypothetical protein [Larsenimonas salina]|uniref:hypothetical protein n=1 Tax=Larsenimonas salina TaxID=1295565 RepID=UPI00207409C8|nr:hypothetical protein [Larsenimonas salina]MCM5705120.1 hypothetical protein [Larsenimonas salina]